MWGAAGSLGSEKRLFPGRRAHEVEQERAGLRKGMPRMKRSEEAAQSARGPVPRRPHGGPCGPSSQGAPEKQPPPATPRSFGAQDTANHTHTCAYQHPPTSTALGVGEKGHASMLPTPQAPNLTTMDGEKAMT